MYSTHSTAFSDEKPTILRMLQKNRINNIFLDQDFLSFQSKHKGQFIIPSKTSM